MSGGTSAFGAFHAQLRGLKERADEVKSLLEQQQQLLRRRGIRLPSDAIDRLWSLRSSIDRLSVDMVDTQMQLAQLRRLAETTALINSAQQTDRVLNQVVDTVINLTQAERGYIVLKNHQTGALEFKVARGLSAEETAAGGRIVSWSIINQVMETGEAVLTMDAGTDDNLSASESIVGFNLRSVLAVPLKARDQLIGVAYCDNRVMAGLFKENELNLLTSFGQQAAVAIENARLFEEIRAQMALIEEMQVRLSNIFASIGSGVFTIDSQNRVIICNLAAEALTGKSAEAAVGLPLSDLLPAVSSGFYAEIEHVRRDQSQRIWAERFLHLGRERYWQVVASPLRGDDQVIYGVALVIDDLTQRKEQEEQRRLLGTFIPEALLANIDSISALDTSPVERTVTAMFADVRGFTAFGETLQPEDLMRIVNRYLGAASDAIDAQDGLVDQYLGDAIKALWNSQLNSQADHAMRALLAAQGIMAAANALHRVLPPDHRLRFGIGIHTGQALLGMVGGTDRSEYAVLGEAANECMFLQENAEPGEIVISQATFALVSDRIRAQPFQPTKMKSGFKQHETVYRVLLGDVEARA
ncbi:MAG: GAF domain-containing protein [Chloroflexi bacterium]|nr:GAF domain-containing protein [Chloroflexota bacterium]MCY3583257.1 GAF domain-containing protein [Chloroflexota bacterium]MCY3717726.1 GAF domain-containing protein [Chloroflexota bacterium]MDE2651772.1 GAF domain-containing protein [Chloroflexota bacterium]MXX84478.1 GAF domain-containing protein [Chloroflexota bacterium]